MSKEGLTVVETAYEFRHLDRTYRVTANKSGVTVKRMLADAFASWSHPVVVQVCQAKNFDEYEWVPMQECYCQYSFTSLIEAVHRITSGES
jgi:hypothetical protein